MDRRFLGPGDVDIVGQAICRALGINPNDVTEVHLHLSVSEMPTATVEVFVPGSVLTELVVAEMTELRARAGR